METLVKETDAKNLKQAEYTEESWAVFEGAYADAKAVLENTDALQSEIDAAYEALENAVSGLKKVETDNKKDDDKKGNDNYLHNPTLNKREIFHSGIEIGKDMIGTMTNTLILAFAGSAFIILLVFISYQVQFNQLIGERLK